ncbi:MAG: sigma-70 family RNA polymerase sigma factor [Armatimonadota bacterium]|nr:sigma-70 family RNA polymerase sigma factor [bacterium]
MEIEVTLNQQRGIAGSVDTIEADEALAHRIGLGDTDAWDRFFDRYSSWAYRFAYYHLGRNHADAEDLCSDIILTAAKSIGKFNPKRGDLDAWVHGLARNRLARFCRSRRIELPLIPDFVDQSSDSESTSSGLSDKVQMQDVVNRALACLPERQAAALIAKYVEGYTTDELAQRIQSSPKAAESLLVRARASFRSAFNRLLGSTEGDSYE